MGSETWKIAYGSQNFNWSQATGSFSGFRWPQKPDPKGYITGSGIYPHYNSLRWFSQPSCSPPGEFYPSRKIVNLFKNPETCFEFYRRKMALGWTTLEMGEGSKMPRNFNWKLVGSYMFAIGLCLGASQLFYSTAVHYPKTYNQDWAEAEVLHPRLNRSHLQRHDYSPLATLYTFDARWPRWAKVEN